MPRFRLYAGDSLKVLRSIPSESIDALVTDPPAGIDFMGKAWDSFKGERPAVQASRKERRLRARNGFIRALRPIFAECERILKPGAYGVVWALPRTSGWTQTALEYAGFEIRDVVGHVFASGFPKSLDVSKAIDKMAVLDPETGAFSFRGTIPEMYVVTEKIARYRDERGVRNEDIDALFGTHGMAGHWTAGRGNSQPAVPSLDQWAKIREFLGVTDPELDADVARLCGRKGQVGDGWLLREVTGEHAAPPPASVWQAKLGENVKAPEAKERRDEPHTPEAAAWEGWGTALKPAREDWILVRKEPVGAIAANVLRHGVGAINVDACRVPVAQADRDAIAKPHGWTKAGYEAPPAVVLGEGIRTKPPVAGPAMYHPEGRWPPNLLLSHADGCRKVGTKRIKASAPPSGPTWDGPSASPSRGLFAGTDAPPASYGDSDGCEVVDAWECVDGCPVKLLDGQSGPSESQRGVLTSKPGDVYGGGKGLPAWTGEYGFDDSGGASRFFPTFASADDATLFRYVAKPSTEERDRGLEDLPVARVPSKLVAANGSGDHRLDGAPVAERANVHPTVKAIALMRWLCRLVTPKGGTVIDPFMGSGSTGIACSVEGFEFIGIEREPLYYEISRRRILADAPLFNRRAMVAPPVQSQLTMPFDAVLTDEQARAAETPADDLDEEIAEAG